MNSLTDTSLLRRAERLLGSAAAATLGLVPLSASATGTADLVVQGSGAYFYNGSGYFADWRGRPDGSPVNEVNADGSAKLYGSVAGSAQQFVDHNCEQDRGCSWYPDRGVVLAWWGTLRAPAQEGDRLALHYDLSVQMPDVGGSWSLAAGISAWDFGQSNSIAWRPIDEEQLGAGTHQLSGTVYSRTVESWDIQAGSPLIYWQVAVAASAGWPWGERYWSDHYGSWVTPFRGVSLTVPNQSIDVTFLTSPVPEPASHGVWLAGLTGLWILRRTKARE